MTINLRQTGARLERKRDELRETLAQLRKLYAADSSKPSNGVEDTEEVARETAEREEDTLHVYMLHPPISWAILT